MLLIARTRTYFTSTDYSRCKGEEIRIRKCDVSNDPSASKSTLDVVDQNTAVYAGTKEYDASFIWGQLVGWHKQTVDKPNASLSADRRGTLSLPELESLIFDETGKPQGTGRKKREAKANQKRGADPDSSSEEEVVVRVTGTRSRRVDQSNGGADAKDHKNFKISYPNKAYQVRILRFNLCV